MPETTPLIKAALNLRGGAGFDVYGVSVESSVITSVVSVRSVSAFVSLCPSSGSVAVVAFSDSATMAVASQLL